MLTMLIIKEVTKQVLFVLPPNAIHFVPESLTIPEGDSTCKSKESDVTI